MLDNVVDALAVHRLTKLVIDDELTAPLREKVFTRFGGPDESKVSYAVTCPWCSSMWVAFGVVAVRALVPKAWRPLAYALAYSSLTGWIEEHS